MKKFLIALVLLISIKGLGAFAQQESAQQVLNATLPEVLSIAKVIVNNVEYERNGIFTNVTIKNVDTSNPNIYPLGLSPMVVRVHTNLTRPIFVSAKFQELKHETNPYQFNTSDLSFSPSSYTINNPYDNVETGVFTPIASARPEAAAGSYIGKILFTLGTI